MAHKHANICGIHFTAGENMHGNKDNRCGSMITAVINGRSVYGYVESFFTRVCMNDRDIYVHVRWLPRPVYPFLNSPLVVRIPDTGDVPNIPNFISVYDIDPSRIILERSDIENSWYVYRIEGLDTIPQ